MGMRHAGNGLPGSMTALDMLSARSVPDPSSYERKGVLALRPKNLDL